MTKPKMLTEKLFLTEEKVSKLKERAMAGGAAVMIELLNDWLELQRLRKEDAGKAQFAMRRMSRDEPLTWEEIQLDPDYKHFKAVRDE